jgi:PEGA domain-containing protein
MKILWKSRGRLFTAAIATAIGLTFSLPAVAQPAPPKPATPAPPAAPAAKPGEAKPGDPKAMFTAGEKKFKAGDFAGALTDFEASNAAKPTPEAQNYIAKSHDNLQHFPEAVTAYEKLIADNPPKLSKEVEEAKKRVEAIKAMPGKVHVETTPPGASVVIDQSQTPHPNVTPTDIDLPPGKHTLIIGAEGYENTTKEVEVGYGSKQDVTAELPKKGEPPPAPPVAAEGAQQQPAAPAPPPEPRSKVPAYITGAVAIVAAGVGTGFGIAALNQSSDFEKKPTTETADDGENNALVADMMFGIAITFGVTSAVLFLSSDAPASAKGASRTRTATRSAPKPAKKTPRIIPTPYVTSTGGGAGALFRF